MFGFDFSELVVVFVVALIVLGPTRLPVVARKVGRWIGKARAMASDFRQQLENEVTLDELNRMTRETTKQNQAATATQTTPTAPAGSSETAQTDALGSTPPIPDSMANSGYPYGAPAEAPATPAPAPAETHADATQAGPQPGDDTYSHAHAKGAAPEPWSPDPMVADAARPADPVPTGDVSLAPDPGAPDADRQRS